MKKTYMQTVKTEMDKDREIRELVEWLATRFCADMAAMPNSRPALWFDYSWIFAGMGIRELRAKKAQAKKLDAIMARV